MPVLNLLYLDVKHGSIHLLSNSRKKTTASLHLFSITVSMGAKTMPDAYCTKHGGFPGFRTFTLSRIQKLHALIQVLLQGALEISSFS